VDSHDPSRMSDFSDQKNWNINHTKFVLYIRILHISASVILETVKNVLICSHVRFYSYFYVFKSPSRMSRILSPVCSYVRFALMNLAARRPFSLAAQQFRYISSRACTASLMSVSPHPSKMQVYLMRTADRDTGPCIVTRKRARVCEREWER